MIDECPTCKDNFDVESFFGNPDFRPPEYAQEIQHAIADGIAVHDIDGDCVGEYVTETNRNGVAMVQYRLVGGTNLWTKPIDSFYIPITYAVPVSEDQVNAAIASIMGNIDD